jgi:hypothetical protein
LRLFSKVVDDMTRGLRSAAYIMALVVFTHGPDAWGRGGKPWSYGDLFKSADLVLIADARDVRDAGGAVKDTPPREGLIGILSTFDVTHVIKGTHKESKLVVFHYRFDERIRNKIGNGPRLVLFRVNSTAIEYRGGKVSLGPGRYMLFLKRRGDCRYECVSGQYDAYDSVKELIGPLPDW